MKKCLAILMCLAILLGAIGWAEGDTEAGGDPPAKTEEREEPKHDSGGSDSGNPSGGGNTDPGDKPGGGSGSGDDSGDTPGGSGDDSGDTPGGSGGDSGDTPGGSGDDSGDTPGGSADDSGDTPGGGSDDSGDTPGGDPTPKPGDPTLTPSPSPEPEDPEKARILKAQEWLIKLEYLAAGHLTGELDEATADALKRFQSDNGLSVTGELDDRTYDLLKQKAGGDAPVDPDGPQPFPGGRPGGFPGGGKRPSGGIPDGMPEEDPADDWLHGVTPGEALTSTHSKGDKDTTLYNALGSASAEALRDACPALELYSGNDVGSLSAAEYSPERTDEGLSLTGEGAVTRWVLDGLTLRTLSRGGVETLTLEGAGRCVTLNTSQTLNGAAYRALRTQGHTDNTFEYVVTLSAAGAQIRVTAGGRTYEVRTNDNGENELFEIADKEA